MEELNILIDFYCTMGNTSKLAKFLRERGFSIRQISYDALRMRERVSIEPARVQLIIERVKALSKTMEETMSMWNHACVEAWIEVHGRRRGENRRVISKDGVCIYVRPGVKGRTVYKVAWIDACREVVDQPIPESTTRKCIQSRLEEVRYIIETIEKFLHIHSWR